MSTEKPNKPKSRSNPDEFQLVIGQAKPCRQDEREIGTDPMRRGHAQ